MKKLHQNMAFSNYGDSLDQCMALSDSLLVLKQYRNGSIRNEQLTEAVNQCIKHIENSIESADLIVIDTLSKNFSGDGDNNKEIGKFINSIEKLRLKTGAKIGRDKTRQLLDDLAATGSVIVKKKGLNNASIYQLIGGNSVS
ncbi:AAA family ATPase [Rubinisphaera sp.]|uniref:AAA family ATPase n=1 Tax=Rubinisphaera sp. TaxID=2024857 RepID=UPI0025DB9BE4|nr:AAA family ATPase [Rubinisphaera sp.]|tara:strand:- start:146 stop:571 length:426 start_codon:yes stop_codon:yes gene_type:complete